MNGLAISFAIPCALVIASHSAIAQSATRADEADPKYMLTTMPEGKGRLRLVAYSIDRDLASSVVHLKGSVQAEIWATAKNPGQAMVRERTRSTTTKLPERFLPMETCG
jgi:hypothetical protein